MDHLPGDGSTANSIHVGKTDMDRILFKLVILVLAGTLLAGPVQAKKPYLTSVNNTCSVSYDCDLCHVDPGGGGPLNTDGEAFAAAGYDPTYFCPGSTCTDGDGDGFATEGGSCGSVDCDDDNADIFPGATKDSVVLVLIGQSPLQ